jgi:phosphoserine aminotransferase
VVRLLLLCLWCSGVPESYAVLFLQGGATTQFSAVPLNFLRGRSSAAYIVSGAWSAAAADEAKRFVPDLRILASTAPEFASFPPAASYSVPADCAYVHYCHNETVHGVEAPYIPHCSAASVPVIADMSSSFMSRPVDVAAHAVIYAGAQKNVGPAGLTIVIARRELLGQAHPLTPLMLDLGLQAAKQSMYNTPPTYAVYITSLVLRHLVARGGLQAVEADSRRKAALVYAAVDQSGGFYRACVQQRDCRSRMNAVFVLRESQLTAAMVREAEAAGLIGIAGHRSVGGVRVSMYNAVTLEDCQALVDFMQRFAEKHSKT